MRALLQVRLNKVTREWLTQLEVVLTAWAPGGGRGQLTSYIQAVVTGKLGEGRHVVGVIGQLVCLLSNAACSLLDAVVVAVLQRRNKWVIQSSACNHLQVIIGCQISV